MAFDCSKVIKKDDGRFHTRPIDALCYYIEEKKKECNQALEAFHRAEIDHEEAIILWLNYKE